MVDLNTSTRSIMDGTNGINLLFSNGPTDNLYCIEYI